MTATTTAFGPVGRDWAEAEKCKIIIEDVRRRKITSNKILNEVALRPPNLGQAVERGEGHQLSIVRII